MQKIGYTKTSRDNGGPLFMFTDGGNDYMVRLAGNPILLLEYYYKLKGGEEFMKVYKDVTENKGKSTDSKKLKILAEAKKFCEDFINVTGLLESANKSLLVVYKE